MKNNHRIQSFLWIYFWVTFVFLLYLMTDKLNCVENQIKSQKCDHKDLEILKYGSEISKSDSVKCICNEHKVKGNYYFPNIFCNIR